MSVAVTVLGVLDITASSKMSPDMEMQCPSTGCMEFTLAGPSVNAILWTRRSLVWSVSLLFSRIKVRKRCGAYRNGIYMPVAYTRNLSLLTVWESEGADWGSFKLENGFQNIFFGTHSGSVILVASLFNVLDPSKQELQGLSELAVEYL